MRRAMFASGRPSASAAVSILLRNVAGTRRTICECRRAPSVRDGLVCFMPPRLPHGGFQFNAPADNAFNAINLSGVPVDPSAARFGGCRPRLADMENDVVRIAAAMAGDQAA